MRRSIRLRLTVGSRSMALSPTGAAAVAAPAVPLTPPPAPSDRRRVHRPCQARQPAGRSPGRQQWRRQAARNRARGRLRVVDVALGQERLGPGRDDVGGVVRAREQAGGGCGRGRCQRDLLVAGGHETGSSWCCRAERTAGVRRGSRHRGRPRSASGRPAVRLRVSAAGGRLLGRDRNLSLERRQQLLPTPDERDVVGALLVPEHEQATLDQRRQRGDDGVLAGPRDVHEVTDGSRAVDRGPAAPTRPGPASCPRAARPAW